MIPALYTDKPDYEEISLAENTVRVDLTGLRTPPGYRNAARGAQEKEPRLTIGRAAADWQRLRNADHHLPADGRRRAPVHNPPAGGCCAPSRAGKRAFRSRCPRKWNLSAQYGEKSVAKGQ